MSPTNPPELRSFVRIWRNFPDSWFDKGMKTEIRRLTSAEYLLATPALVDLYIEAMDYPVNVRAQRISSWRQEALSPGFAAIAAVADDTIIGIAYGMLGQRERWWDQQLRRALAMQGGRRKAKRSYSKATLRSLKSMCSLAIKGEVSARGCSGSSCALRRQNLPYCLPLRSSTRTTARSSSTANLGSPTSHVTTSTPLIRGHLRFLGDRCHSAPHQCCRFVVVTR